MKMKTIALAALPFGIVAAAACGVEGAASEEPEDVAQSADALEQTLASTSDPWDLGREVAVAHHLQDGDEYVLDARGLFAHGKRLFTAVWTPQEGGGRPMTKGNGEPLSDPTMPLVFPRNFNRISAMDSNSCASCHNAPFAGGGGHFVANAFIPGQRFDFLTFDDADTVKTKGNVDERGVPTNLITNGTGVNAATNSRATLGMFGAGFIEMLTRQMTADLQTIRNSIPAGGEKPLVTKGVDFGMLARRTDGTWDVSKVSGISKQSLQTTGASDPPSLVLRPFHQQSLVVSIREFTNNAMNHHHGIQTTERFGKGTDPDGDGMQDEMSRADVTATAIFQAALPVPGRVISRHPNIEKAVWTGEQKFDQIGCTSCHRASLPLDEKGWIYTEPNPFNPAKNLRPGDAAPVAVDLTSKALPGPRLAAKNGVVNVPAYTDLKLHDITTGPDDPNCDPIDMQENATVPQSGSMTTPNAKFFAGTCKFLTKKLWGAANEPPFFHHGKFTTLREAIMAHHGEAQATNDAFNALTKYDQDAIIEFLKSLQVLPPGARSLVVDERGMPRAWPPTAN
jgi:cytochrome c peroxidase